MRLGMTWRIKPGRIVDLFAWGAVWGVAVKSLASAFGSQSHDPTEWLLMFFPIAAPVWVGLRLAPRLAGLADVGRRETLAVTLLDPRSYLSPRLVPCRRGALLMFPSAYYVVLAGAFYIGMDAKIVDGTTIAIFLATYMLLACSLAFLACCLAFLFLCQRRRTDVWSSVAPVLCGAIASGVVGGCVAYAVWFVNHTSHEEWSFVLTTCAFTIMSFGSVVGGVWAWRKAINEYYVFEKEDGKDDPAKA